LITVPTVKKLIAELLKTLRPDEMKIRFALPIREAQAASLK
jgi:hypothetical protein